MSPTSGEATERERRWTVLSILRTTTTHFEKRGVSEPRLSAEHLLADVLDCGRLDLYLAFDRPLDASEIDSYRERVKRRLAGEPIQYITGVAAFRDLELKVDRRVLVPRSETEVLVGEVLAWARAEAKRERAPAEGWRMADLGTGSGAIACALAAELEHVRWVLGIDLSVEALVLARENAARAGADRTRWVASDGFASMAPAIRFDAIVANPPYVAEGDRGVLPREVVEWEPGKALFAGPRGDEMLARIVGEAPGRLRSEGLLALEVGAGQARRVRESIEAHAGLEYLSTFRDHAGVERGVLALGKEEGR